MNVTVSEFKGMVERDGLDDATEEFGVSQEIQELRDVAELKHTNKIGLPEMIEGARIATKLRELHIDPESLIPILDQVYRRAKQKGYNGADIVDQCQEISELESKYKTNVDVLIQKFENIGSKLPAEERKLKGLTKEVQSLEIKKLDLWQQHSVAEQELSDYITMKKELRSLGLDIKKLQSIKKCLLIMKERKFKASSIISRIQSIENFEPKKESLKRELDQLREKEKKIESKLTESNKTLSKMQPLLKQLKELENTNFSVEQMHRIRNMLVEISVNLGVKPADSVSRFEEFLKSYGALLELESQVASLRVQKERLETDIDELENAKRQVISGLEEVNRVMIKEVKDTGSKITSEVTSQVKDLSKAIEGYAPGVQNLTKELEKAQKEVDDLKDRALQTGEEIEKLRSLRPLNEFIDSGQGDRALVLLYSQRYAQSLARWAGANGLGDIGSQASELGREIHYAIVGR